MLRLGVLLRAEEIKEERNKNERFHGSTPKLGWLDSNEHDARRRIDSGTWQTQELSRWCTMRADLLAVGVEELLEISHVIEARQHDEMEEQPYDHHMAGQSQQGDTITGWTEAERAEG